MQSRAHAVAALLLAAAAAAASGAWLRPPDKDFEFADTPPDYNSHRCVSCSESEAGGPVCGSDNRTYASLCRLDLAACEARGPRPGPACPGPCPCRAPAPATCPHTADRVLDWLGALRAAAPHRAAPPARAFPRPCRPEARWAWARLDADADGALSAHELRALRPARGEHCVRRYLAACGASRAAWCTCARRGRRPCAALRAAGGGEAGGWRPACDARGLYRARQCHAARGVCWCVTPHGEELPGTRTRGALSCPNAAAAGTVSVVPAAGAGRGAGELGRGRWEEAEDGAGAPADDEDAAGSGDNELRL